MGLAAAPFLAKGHGVCRRGRFPDSRLSARRFLLARLRRNLGAARSATSSGTILPGLLCANRASRASGRLASAAPADHSGGTVAEFHGLPVPPASLIFIRSLCGLARDCQICCAARNKNKNQNPVPNRGRGETAPIRKNALWRRFVGAPAHGVDPPAAFDQDCGVAGYVMLAVGGGDVDSYLFALRVFCDFFDRDFVGSEHLVVRCDYLLKR